MGSPSLHWKPPAPPAPPASSAKRGAATQRAITEFIDVQGASATHRVVDEDRATVVSLFDPTGLGLRCWAERGYECHAYAHSDKSAEWRDTVVGMVHVHIARLTSAAALAGIALRHGGQVAFACASPPSRDLSVAGARHWKRKRDKDPEFQERAVDLVRQISSIFERWECPYYIANPASSQLGRLWRAPNYTYQPHEFGAYLSPSDAHPLHPETIPAQDAYTQHQGLWTGGGLRMPVTKPVEPTWKYFTSARKGGGLAHTRRMSPILFWNARGARACTPRAFALALCMRLLGEQP